MLLLDYRYVFNLDTLSPDTAEDGRKSKAETADKPEKPDGTDKSDKSDEKSVQVTFQVHSHLQII